VTVTGGLTTDTLTIGTSDLLSAVMQGTYPATLGYSGDSVSHFFCGPAYASLDLTVPAGVPGTGPDDSSSAYGEMIFTTDGSFTITNESSGQFGAGTAGCGASDICYGPLNFNLIATSTTPALLTVTGYVDDGPSYFYVNGTQIKSYTINGVGATSLNTTFKNATFALPGTITAGTPFTLSVVACSSNGTSIGFALSQFIDENNLIMNYDAAFHRTVNGTLN
jgi:hypothetical protein